MRGQGPGFEIGGVMLRMGGWCTTWGRKLEIFSKNEDIHVMNSDCAVSSLWNIQIYIYVPLFRHQNLNTLWKSGHGSCVFNQSGYDTLMSAVVRGFSRCFLIVASSFSRLSSRLIGSNRAGT